MLRMTRVSVALREKRRRNKVCRAKKKQKKESGENGGSILYLAAFTSSFRYLAPFCFYLPI